MLLGSVFLHSNCKKGNKDVCKEDTSLYAISAYEKTAFYGNGRDTLSFVNTTTLDTLVFYGNGFNTTWNDFTVYPNDEILCQLNYKLEVYWVKYYERKTKETITLSAYYGPFFRYPSVVHFNIKYKDVGYSTSISTVLSANPGRDTVTYQGKIITAVTAWSYYNVPVGGYLAKYSKDLGVIRMQLSNNQYLEKISN